MLGLASYDKFAKRWSATTGRVSTTGKVIWHQHQEDRVLLIYQYRVDGLLFQGDLRAPRYGEAKFLEDYPVGCEVTVYHAEKDPAYSRAIRPPQLNEVVGRTLLLRLAVPLIVLNGISWVVFFIVNNA